MINYSLFIIYSFPSKNKSRESAIESIIQTSDSGLLIAGVTNSKKGTLEGFKSYGNPVSGDAYVMYFSEKQIYSEIAPKNPTWEVEFKGALSIKHLAEVLDGRGFVLAAHADGESAEATVLKISATGGVLSVAKNSKNPQFTESEIKAIVEAAQDYDMHVAAHAHGPEGMKRAIRAGVHSIEHGTIMDGEVLALMKKYGTYYVPTISAGMFVAEKAKLSGYYPPVIVPKALEIGPRLLNTFTTAYKFGIKIAFGTDSGVSYHGNNAMEFSYMVKGGMTEMEAIRSATITASEMLGISDELGSVESGKLADLIAVEGNPIKDITALQKVVFVMKEGKIYKLPK